jgi:hypothetical protein
MVNGEWLMVNGEWKPSTLQEGKPVGSPSFFHSLNNFVGESALQGAVSRLC